MSDITNILIQNKFTVTQLKLLISVLGNTPKSTKELSNTLNFTVNKTLLELKKINCSDVKIEILLDSVKIDIGTKNYILENPKTIGKSNSIEIINKDNEKEVTGKRVFDFWISTMISPEGKIKKTKFSTYKSIILNSLKNYTECELNDAILGCSRSLWHMGYDDKGCKTHKRYDSLDLILRTTKIEGFIAMKDQMDINQQLQKIKSSTKIESSTSRDDWAASRNHLIG